MWERCDLGALNLKQIQGTLASNSLVLAAIKVKQEQDIHPLLRHIEICDSSRKISHVPEKYVPRVLFFPLGQKHTFSYQ